jgi:hypothetical protein
VCVNYFDGIGAKVELESEAGEPDGSAESLAQHWFDCTRWKGKDGSAECCKFDWCHLGGGACV